MVYETDNRRTILIGIVVLIILVGAGIFIYMFFMNSKTEAKDVGNAELNIPELKSESLDNTISDIMDKFYTDVFYGHKEAYCGEYDNSDIISSDSLGTNIYYRSNTYDTLDDLKAHLNTYMTADLTNSIIYEGDTSKYQEVDDKLYCLVVARGALAYNKNGATYNILDSTDSTITATANVSVLAEGDAPYTITANLGFEKINDVWLLSTYKEVN